MLVFKTPYRFVFLARFLVRMVLITKKMMTAALTTTSTDNARWVIGRCTGCSFSVAALRSVRGSLLFLVAAAGVLATRAPLLAAGEAASGGLFSFEGAPHSKPAKDKIRTASNGRTGRILLRSGTTWGGKLSGGTESGSYVLRMSTGRHTRLRNFAQLLRGCHGRLQLLLHLARQDRKSVV